jgi:hypothetical protein
MPDENTLTPNLAEMPTLAEELILLEKEVEETDFLIFGPQPTEAVATAPQTTKIDYFIEMVMVLRDNMKRINEALGKLGPIDEPPKGGEIKCR